jgi:Domain of unknown function (DUF1844)
VSSLWTPSGEHEVERRPSGPPRGDDTSRGGPPPGSSSGGGGAGSRAPAGEPSPDEAEFDEVRRQLIDAPVEVVIANHAYGLFELAALHLSEQPPNLVKARVAVDALGAIVEGLRGRLGEVEPALDDALAQIRMAYVQISNQAGNGQQPEAD